MKKKESFCEFRGVIFWGDKQEKRKEERMERMNFVKDGVLRLPPGFRFHPTDEELVVQYLKRKVFACPLPASIIPEVDVCKSDPWDLPGNGMYIPPPPLHFFYLIYFRRSEINETSIGYDFKSRNEFPYEMGSLLNKNIWLCRR